MIKFEKIEFHNYRQYKNIQVDFDNEKEYNLHILKAKNGTGKTTFLNGILWCLYEKEYYISNKDKALEIINSSVVQTSEENTGLEVSVKITISDEKKYITFERRQKYSVSVDPLNNKKSVAAAPSTFMVTETYKNSVENTKTYDDNIITDNIVKQYFDESIYDYYFFDGENLKSYFSNDKQKIRDSIFNISQVTLLKNASKRITNLCLDKRKIAEKLTGEDFSYYDEANEIRYTIAKYEKENENILSKLPGLKTRVEGIDNVLIGYQPVKASQIRRNELNNKLNNLNKEYEELKTQKHLFIRTYLTLLNFYPRVKKTLDMINEKQSSGNLPPSIDKKQIKDIINNNIQNCPVCNHDIDEKAIDYLNELLNTLDVSAKTSNYLMEIKGGLEEVVNKCKRYTEERDKLLNDEKYYITEISSTKKELDEISSFLSNYLNENGSGIDVPKLEERRKELTEEIRSKELRKALNDKEIENYRKRLEEKELAIKKLEEDKKHKTTLNKQIAVLNSLATKIDKVQQNIMNEIKDEIEEKTWKCFESMIWKKNTFGGIQINDLYQLTMYNIFHDEMTGSLSATEYMALAYAFTLAIHEASGRNCPLVVDSPLGRVSDENRVNMANELLKISKDKQIIMLFTPDEYSKEVEEIYNQTAASIRNITLNSNENEVQEVGE